MQLSKHLPKLALIALALGVTLLISLVIPEKQFAPFTLEPDSVWPTQPDARDYLVDFANDSAPELVRHSNINKTGHSIEFGKGKRFKVVFFFQPKEYFISKSLKFFDVNNDGIKDILFLSVLDSTALLNIMEFDAAPYNTFTRRKTYAIKIDKITYHNNLPDVENTDMAVFNGSVWFNLNGGYSIQPRHVYCYNPETKNLTKTPVNGLNINKIELLKHNQHIYLLPRRVNATGNTVGHKLFDKFKRAKDPDSLRGVKTLQKLLYDYGDFSSFILLYNHNLELEFKPIEIDTWTNFTESGWACTDSSLNIVALINATFGDTSEANITLCNLKGRILKQIPLPRNFQHVFTHQQNVVFSGPQSLFVYSPELELKKTIPGITNAIGFIDLTKDHDPEFIGFNKNQLVVFSPNFARRTVYPVEQELIPLPEDQTIQTFTLSNRNCLMFSTRMFNYLFSYRKNNLALARYPFYLMLFATAYGLLFLLVKLNTRRLEAEKLRLEKVVIDRTSELRTSNEQLAIKNQEIEHNAEVLKEKNIHLSQLDQFKRILISTLVHDLKNPLSQIITITPDKRVKHMSAKMLGLVTNLLDVEKHEHTAISPDKQTLPLDPLINEAMMGQEVSLTEKNLTINYTTDCPTVEADPALLSRVVENLLTNAIRHSPLNATIAISATTQPDGKVEVVVSNPGSHIGQEMLQTIFDKYVQGAKTSSSGYRTTGLGLTFCRMVVEAHGHTIKASNTTNGVAFSFTLDGNSSANHTKQTTTTNEKPELSGSDRELLKPWISQLQQLDVHRISEISRIAATIPDDSPAMLSFKNALLDAAFASNEKQFSELVKGGE